MEMHEAGSLNVRCRIQAHCLSVINHSAENSGQPGVLRLGLPGQLGRLVLQLCDEALALENRRVLVLPEVWAGPCQLRLL